MIALYFLFIKFLVHVKVSEKYFDNPQPKPIGIVTGAHEKIIFVRFRVNFREFCFQFLTRDVQSRDHLISSPFVPLGPCIPGGPTEPISPFSPFSPFSPGGPGSPLLPEEKVPVGD